MPLLYLDSTGNYSDPATTNLKYLRRGDEPDGTYRVEWAAPSDQWKYLDATHNWSVPEIAPWWSKLRNWDDVSWEQISQFGQKTVLMHPERFNNLLNVTKTIWLDSPVKKSIEFEIVDIAHCDWGPDIAFVWMPKERLLQEMAFVNHHTYAYYWESLIRTALQSDGDLFNSFPQDIKEVWRDITYKCLTRAQSKHSPYGTESIRFSAYGEPSSYSDKLVIPAVVEIGLLNELPEHGGEYHKEGTTFKAFASGSINDRIRSDVSGKAEGWFLRSLSHYYLSTTSVSTGIGGIQYNGKLVSFDADDSYGVVPCFAV